MLKEDCIALGGGSYEKKHREHKKKIIDSGSKFTVRLSALSIYLRTEIFKIYQKDSENYDLASMRVPCPPFSAMGP